MCFYSLPSSSIGTTCLGGAEPPHNMLLVRVKFLVRLEKFFTLREGNNYLKIPLSYINTVRSVITIFVYKFGGIYGIVTFSFVFHSEQNASPFHAFKLSCHVT